MFLSLNFLVLYFIPGIPSLHTFTRGVPATPVNRIVLSLNHLVFCTLSVKKNHITLIQSDFRRHELR